MVEEKRHTPGQSRSEQSNDSPCRLQCDGHGSKKGEEEIGSREENDTGRQENRKRDSVGYVKCQDLTPSL
jgi:hypothetical protein